MKFLLTLLLLTNFAFASYTIKYQGLTLGNIENFDTIKDNYLEATVTNKIARLLLGKDKFVFYNEDYIGKKDDENTKYKKDKYAIVYILKKAAANNTKDERIEVKKDKFIDVKFDKNFNFIYNSRNRIKSKGYFEMKDGELETLIEEINSIKIIKNK
ncbi:hypothetical protein [Poseidonibacter ostreae]|jgi:hypothetical protein|uniref:Uncharacterized protein n=1 Tax=Poseidonibacter ostreae TaxID=2654171 RepID=A0A6L4WSN7_9BACT|nr:hypothetical protein [Poseidonibacter ostreae]KAB7884416.1 hypothetical protein GA417_11800 [Poseidonibacter ostreae]KAB7888798.1 hypothetical protein GBG19_07865 [Poseidonibacter ostreae]KAB7891195.1 hypothetical protein GBG18_07175 [Poseidonibacter ostreae]MAC84853.1 hypothetical protein [Arcobacter sp.]|tara:strand:+ start:2808 stop:3278 length:471 start_codon:yes stop_codon:yes gene_type:complete